MFQVLEQNVEKDSKNTIYIPTVPYQLLYLHIYYLQFNILSIRYFVQYFLLQYREERGGFSESRTASREVANVSIKYLAIECLDKIPSYLPKYLNRRKILNNYLKVTMGVILLDSYRSFM